MYSCYLVPVLILDVAQDASAAGPEESLVYRQS